MLVWDILVWETCNHVVGSFFFIFVLYFESQALTFYEFFVFDFQLAVQARPLMVVWSVRRDWVATIVCEVFVTPYWLRRLAGFNHSLSSPCAQLDCMQSDNEYRLAGFISSIFSSSWIAVADSWMWLMARSSNGCRSAILASLLKTSTITSTVRSLVGLLERPFAIMKYLKSTSWGNGR